MWFYIHTHTFTCLDRDMRKNRLRVFLFTYDRKCESSEREKWIEAVTKEVVGPV